MKYTEIFKASELPVVNKKIQYMKFHFPQMTLFSLRTLHVFMNHSIENVVLQTKPVF